METTFIYALKEPDTGEIRYIGKANDPKQRLRGHVSEARKRPGKTHKIDWIASLLEKGERPILDILDEVSEDLWESAEMGYIHWHRTIGCDLVNGTSGGDGLRGISEETKEKIGSKHRGKIIPEWHRECSRVANTGRKHSPEAIEKIRVASLGNKRMLGKVPWNKGQKNPSGPRGKQKNPRTPSSSKFLGVAWTASKSRWTASITVFGNRFYLGRYTSEIDAATAHDWVASLYTLKQNFA